METVPVARGDGVLDAFDGLFFFFNDRDDAACDIESSHVMSEMLSVLFTTFPKRRAS